MKMMNYSLSDLDHMIPYERDIYIALLLDWIEQQEKRNNQS